MLFLAEIKTQRHEYDGDGGPRRQPKPDPVFWRLVDAPDGESAVAFVEKTFGRDDPYGSSVRVECTIHDTLIAPAKEENKDR